MKEVIEYIGFGNLLTIASVIGSMIWYGSRFGFRIENLEKETKEQKEKHTEHDVEKKTIVSELRKITEWQVARDAKEDFAKIIVAEFSKSNKDIVDALKALKK